MCASELLCLCAVVVDVCVSVCVVRQRTKFVSRVVGNFVNQFAYIAAEAAARIIRRPENKKFSYNFYIHHKVTISLSAGVCECVILLLLLLLLHQLLGVLEKTQTIFVIFYFVLETSECV